MQSSRACTAPPCSLSAKACLCARTSAGALCLCRCLNRAVKVYKTLRMPQWKLSSTVDRILQVPPGC